ncbi:hypothetical protein [Halosegnis sp.]|uniref:hypothetical protein n=1 Tax=Halosegnis sp. TaxID=2864959 RepID=UPI0035D43291
MATTSGRFRVYRVLGAVLHINLFDVADRRLYSVYQTDYPAPLQSTVDSLATGDMIEATVTGDPEAPQEPWRLEAAEREDTASVDIDFAVGVEYPDVARQTWERALAEASEEGVVPTGRALGTQEGDEAAGEVWVQPRDSLPDGGFTPAVAAGRLPLEPWLERLPYADAPAEELLAIEASDPDEPVREPYGVFLFFTKAGRGLADRYRERWDLPRGADSRPDFDPY